MSTRTANHNYLLNFTYERPSSESTTYKKRNSRNTRNYNKEHYLHANFRFVISPSAPVAHPAIYEADTLIDWDFVDEVCLSKPTGAEQSTCPICLDALRVPKITRCGHIFCTTCILRHLHPYETHRCPMCFDLVARSDLRPIEIKTTVQAEVNGRLEFVLLSRVKGTLNPKRVEEGPAAPPNEAPDEEEEEEEVLSLRSFLPLVGTEDASFARLVLGSRDMQAACFAKEEEELRQIGKELHSEGEEGYVVVVEEALRGLEERRRMATACMASCTPSSATTTTTADRQSPIGRRSRPRGESGGDEMLQFVPDSPCGGDTTTGGEREAKAAVPPPPPSDMSHFFQLSDGQYVFLHPLNMKCLMAEADGSYSRLPSRVEGKVLEIEAMMLTPEIRSRWPFLKHLPLYSHVQLVELDIKLSDATYARFKPDIQKRKQRRKSKLRADARQKTGGKSAEEQKCGGALCTYSDEALQELRARREHVDLTGPLPWEASLMGEEKNFNKVAGTSPPAFPERSGGSSPMSADSPDTPTESSGVWGGGRRGGSFAEITKMNGHFPALGGGGKGPPSPLDSETSTTTTTTTTTNSLTSGSPPIGMSPPSIWASRNPLLSSSPPQFSLGHSPSSWPARHHSPLVTGTTNSSRTSISSSAWQQLIDSSSLSAEAAGKTTPLSESSGNAGSSSKKKKAKGVPLFSTASQRKY